MRTATAIFHVAFEDLGTLHPALLNAGFRIEAVEASTCDWAQLDPTAPDLVVVMGGPIGVYDSEAYPFLQKELEFLRQRLAGQRPTLGICLGAQLMAAALGARVYPGTNGKEIGWSRLEAAPEAQEVPGLMSLFAPEVQVLHWHGDTFDLPPGALHLAQSSQYKNQAFSLGNYGLALQFHAEVTAQGLERWYVGHACELAHAEVAVSPLRQQGAIHAPRLEPASAALWSAWLGAITARRP